MGFGHAQSAWDWRFLNKPALLDFAVGDEEDSPENRTAYMLHLTTHVRLPTDYLMGMCRKGGFWCSRIWGNRSIKELLMSWSRNQETLITMRSGTLLKLCLKKKPKNLQNKDHNPQTITRRRPIKSPTMVWFLF
jgi:hypothetical protein